MFVRRWETWHSNLTPNSDVKARFLAKTSTCSLLWQLFYSFLWVVSLKPSIHLLLLQLLPLWLHQSKTFLYFTESPFKSTLPQLVLLTLFLITEPEIKPCVFSSHPTRPGATRPGAVLCSLLTLCNRFSRKRTTPLIKGKKRKEKSRKVDFSGDPLRFSQHQLQYNRSLIC